MDVSYHIPANVRDFSIEIKMHFFLCSRKQKTGHGRNFEIVLISSSPLPSFLLSFIRFKEAQVQVMNNITVCFSPR